MRWRASTVLKLVLSGWRPGRNALKKLALPDDFPRFQVANQFLAEFGGLRFGKPMDYVDLSPMLGQEVASTIRALGRVVGVPFYPLGVMHHQDREYILIDEREVIWLLSCDRERAWIIEPWAASISKAIEFMVRRVTHGDDVEQSLQDSGVPRRQFEISIGES
jgi:hypothetical protein